MAFDPKLDYVNAMRGFAILLVIAVHSMLQLKNMPASLVIIVTYCQMGVQLFFVVSAYTLCRSFEQRAEEPLPIVSFYLRRFFRIAPLYYVAIPIYFLFWLAKQRYVNGHIDGVYPYVFSNVLANITFSHGLSRAANNFIVPGGWSIGTEMIFYVVFPWLYSISKLMSSRGVLPIAAFFLALMVICTGMLISEAKYDPETFTNNGFVYFNIISQLPIFLSGVFTYFVVLDRPSGRKGDRPFWLFAFFVFFTGMSLIALMQQPTIPAQVAAILAGWSFCFLLVWSRTINWGNDLVCKIGKLSYSMYIVHFVFAWGLFAYVAKKIGDKLPVELLALFGFFLVTFCSFYAAKFTDRWIESKGITAGKSVVSVVQSWSRKSVSERRRADAAGADQSPP